MLLHARDILTMRLRTLLGNKNLFWFYKKLTDFFAATKWQRTQAVRNNGIYYSLLEEDHNRIRELLKDGYYIILTRRKCHFTTYLIALTSYFATGKMSHYTHALMNVEGDIDNNMDYKLIEATGEGVHWSTFMQVFDCDSVVLMKPIAVPTESWASVMESVKKELGMEYDLLFDINDASKVSCVEMVWQGLKKLPHYEARFPNLIAIIKKEKGELTPQMLYSCKDMEIVFEIRR